MAQMVKCVKLGIEAEGLDRPPYPGELGRRIFVLRPSPVVRRGLAPGGLASVFRFIDDEAELETYS